jgi:hypothetical protein
MDWKTLTLALLLTTGVAQASAGLGDIPEFWQDRRAVEDLCQAYGIMAETYAQQRDRGVPLWQSLTNLPNWNSAMNFGVRASADQETILRVAYKQAGISPAGLRGGTVRWCRKQYLPQPSPPKPK